jgi:alpha-beta hydrolase superfamily lysophospholipase
MFARHAVPAALVAGSLLSGFVTPTVADPPPASDTNEVECDEQCQWAWWQQRQNAVPRTEFYDPPSTLPPPTAGTLIRHEPAAEYVVEGGPMVATRVLYRSADSSGEAVAASGVVLVPTGEPPADGWPVILHAHGVSGIGRECAPSLMRDLYHGDQIARFVEQGWAVVAPDYAGLGTDGRHELLNKSAAANDLLGALRAAYEVVPELSSDWLLWGHSQGGAAVLATAERLVNKPEAGYLGAVVTSPASDLRRIVTRAVDQPGLGVFMALASAGAKESEPQLRVERLLTPQALHRLAIAETGCLGVVTAVYRDLSGPDLVNDKFLYEPHFGRFLDTNRTGRRAVAGPVLLLQGEADSVIPVEFTDDVSAGLCQKGVSVDYRTYPGLEHDTYPGVVTGITDGAMPDILDWVGERFDGEPAASTCPAD